MSKEALLKQIADWHTAGEHSKIREAILDVPEPVAQKEFEDELYESSALITPKGDTV